jgi:hypothetical protein
VPITLAAYTWVTSGTQQPELTLITESGLIQYLEDLVDETIKDLAAAKPEPATFRSGRGSLRFERLASGNKDEFIEAAREIAGLVQQQAGTVAGNDLLLVFLCRKAVDFQAIFFALKAERPVSPAQPEEDQLEGSLRSGLPREVWIYPDPALAGELTFSQSGKFTRPYSLDSFDIEVPPDTAMATLRRLLLGAVDAAIDRLEITGDQRRDIIRNGVLKQASGLRPSVETSLTGYVTAWQDYSDAQSKLRNRVVPWLRPRTRQSKTKSDNARAQLVQDLNAVAVDQISALLNERNEQLRAYDTRFDTTEAPRLVELDTPPVAIGEAFQILSSFIEGHDTSAVGISGRRGAGKSTLLQRLCSSLTKYGVVIPAPTEYAPADFVRYVHAEVAKQILLAEGGRESGLPRRGVVDAQRMAIVTTLIYGGIGLIVLSIFYHKTLSSFGAVGLAGAALVLAAIYMMVGYFFRRRASRLGIIRGTSPLGLIAGDELVGLRWETTIGQRTKNSLPALMNFAMEDEEEVAMAERDRSHPERVADFKNFIARCRAERPDMRIVVAIDELDKLPNRNAVVRLINGLKDMFHLPGVHFVVTVSEDALESFAARGIPIRDAFDSAFDTILHVRRSSVSDSELLLGSRAIGFPYSAILLCHALSGGLPRELIRVARKCVSTRNTIGVALSIETLADALVRDEITDRLNVAVALAYAVDDQKAAAVLAELRTQARDETYDLLPRICDLAKTGIGRMSQPSADHKWYRMSQALPVYLLCLHTVREYFRATESRDNWHADMESGQLVRGFDLLARSVGSIQFTSAQARQDLVSAREELRLVALELGQGFQD